MSNNKALILLNDILPYMLEPSKVYRAKLLLSKYSELTSRNGKYTEVELKNRYEIEELFWLH